MAKRRNELTARRYFDEFVGGKRKVQIAEEHGTSPQLVGYYINTFIKNEATEEDIVAFNNKNKEKTKMENDLDLAEDKIYRDKRAEKKKESLAKSKEMVELVINGKTIAEVADIFNLKPVTISTRIKKYIDIDEDAFERYKKAASLHKFGRYRKLKKEKTNASKI